MGFTETALLASVDQTLASIRAALAAAADPEQRDEVVTRLSAAAGADAARLVAETDRDDWPGVDPSVLDAIRRIEKPMEKGDLERAERLLADARGMLGGPSA